MRKRQASDAANNVVHFDEICTLLGPQGARATIMKRGMSQVRNIITSLCNGAKWKMVEVLSDFGMVSGGVPVQLAARNEKLKVQWLCQIVAAIIAKSDWIILDEADLLQAESWDGMLRVLSAVANKCPEKYILVCATGLEVEIPTSWARVTL